MSKQMGVNVRSDLQEENRKHKPYDAWYKHLPWIQNPKKLVAYGIGMFVFAGTAVVLGLGIYNHQDQLQELSGQATQSINEALRSLSIFVLCPLLLWEILVFLGDFKEKFLSCPSVFYSTADVQDTTTQTDAYLDE